MSPLALAAIALAGALSGFTTGLIGSGGVFLALTLLTIVLGDVQLAIGTTLVYALVVGALASVVHLRAGRFQPDVALAIGLPAAATAVLGATLAEQLPDRVLSLGVVALAAVVVVFTLASARPGEPAEQPQFRAVRATYVGAVLGGVGIGVLQGLFGIAGGFLLLPYLSVVLKVPARLAVACTLVAGVPSLLAGSVSHLVLGNVDPLTLATLLAGALPLAWLGASATGRVSEAALRWVFVCLLTSSCATMLVVLA